MKPLDIKNQDEVVHAVCPYLRLGDCKGCAEVEQHPRWGPITMACYAMAQEVMNICQTGHPHRKSK